MLHFLGVPQWVSLTFPYIQTALLIIIGLSALGIILAILIQPSNPDGGSNAITGVSDSYFLKNKSSTKEGRLKRVIVWCAILVFVCTILYFISMLIYGSGVV